MLGRCMGPPLTPLTLSAPKPEMQTREEVGLRQGSSVFGAISLSGSMKSKAAMDRQEGSQDS